MFRTYTQRLIALLLILLPAIAGAHPPTFDDKPREHVQLKVLEVMQDIENNGYFLREQAKEFLRKYHDAQEGVYVRTLLGLKVEKFLREAQKDNRPLTPADYRLIANTLLFVQCYDQLNLTASDCTQAELNELLNIREKILKIMEVETTTGRAKDAAHRILNAYRRADLNKIVIDQLILQALRQAKSDNHTWTPSDYETLAHFCLAAIAILELKVVIVSKNFAG